MLCPLSIIPDREAPRCRTFSCTLKRFSDWFSTAISQTVGFTTHHKKYYLGQDKHMQSEEELRVKISFAITLVIIRWLMCMKTLSQGKEAAIRVKWNPNLQTSIPFYLSQSLLSSKDLVSLEQKKSLKLIYWIYMQVIQAFYTHSYH